MDNEHTRDVVVVGSSAGGVEALPRLIAGLPLDFQASVLIVQHLSEESPGVLASLLARHTSLPVTTADDGMPLAPNRIYVAPPARHMLVTRGAVSVVFGPRENRSRPAVDALFRTAAVHYGSRVIGVILTGMLGDGASGLSAVERCGGVAIVQSPDDARFPEMPRRALDRVPSALSLPLDEIPRRLDQLTREPAGPSPDVPDSLRLEVTLTERGLPEADWNVVPGAPSRFTCPECSGALQCVDEGEVRRYRCRVGHAFSAADLVTEKTAALENSLWVALQTLEERAEMLREMESSDRLRGRDSTASGFARRADEASRHAALIRETLRELNPD